MSNLWFPNFQHQTTHTHTHPCTPKGQCCRMPYTKQDLPTRGLIKSPKIFVAEVWAKSVFSAAHMLMNDHKKYIRVF